MSSHLKVHQVTNPTHHTELLISLIAFHSPISMDRQGISINEENFSVWNTKTKRKRKKRSLEETDNTDNRKKEHYNYYSQVDE